VVLYDFTPHTPSWRAQGKIYRCLLHIYPSFPSFPLSFCSFLSISFSTSIFLSLCLICIPSSFFFGTLLYFLFIFLSLSILLYPSLSNSLSISFLVFYLSNFILLSFCFNISPFLFLFFAVVLYTLFSFYLSLCIGFCLSLSLSFLLRHLVLRICKIKTWQELKS
jgi:hypothetical protein